MTLALAFWDFCRKSIIYLGGIFCHIDTQHLSFGGDFQYIYFYLRERVFHLLAYFDVVTLF